MIFWWTLPTRELPEKSCFTKWAPLRLPKRHYHPVANNLRPKQISLAECDKNFPTVELSETDNVNSIFVWAFTQKYHGHRFTMPIVVPDTPSRCEKNGGAQSLHGQTRSNVDGDECICPCSSKKILVKNPPWEVSKISHRYLWVRYNEAEKILWGHIFKNGLL